jgi:hypothetical protein
MDTFDIKKAIDAQLRYCAQHNVPDFAPLRDGVCWNCDHNIFTEGGISVEQAASTHITGCPFCHKSYCD